MTGPIAGSDDRVYSFGPFIADPAEGTLYRDGALVALALKSFEVLISLIERRDRVVKKDDIIQLVWPNTFVEENNLARHISTIRKALGDHAHGSAYIITIAGRGYRFVAPVQEIARSGLSSNANVPTPEPAGAAVSDERILQSDSPNRRFALSGAVVVVVAAAMAVGAIIAVRAGLGRPISEAPNRKLWQLTTGGGLDADATWAPDSQRVAYASDRDGNFDIWVQSLGDERPVKLTSSPGHDWEPSWSQDGRQIVFRSERDGGGLFVVSSSGGAERRITTFGFRPEWSSRGGELLFSDSPEPAKLYIVRDDGTNLHRVLADFLSEFRIFKAGWHPDGRRISIY